MKYLIMTDLEGVSGVDSFAQTRTNDINLKREAMQQLALETNACIRGIFKMDSQAQVTVIDGHGSGGLFPEELEHAEYTRYSGFEHAALSEYRALFFVGQHAMAGTIHAPLCHTYSSLSVQYYSLNGVFIGEFAAFASWVGLHGVPTVFIAGDDKAILEAKMFVPEIEGVVTKRGKGIEVADHIPSENVCSQIEWHAAQALQRLETIPALRCFQAPYVFEARHIHPLSINHLRPDARLLDERTYRIETSNYRELPFF